LSNKSDSIFFAEGTPTIRRILSFEEECTHGGMLIKSHSTFFLLLFLQNPFLVELETRLLLNYYRWLFNRQFPFQLKSKEEKTQMGKKTYFNPHWSKKMSPDLVKGEHEIKPVLHAMG
jgi:hypothetical protein